MEVEESNNQDDDYYEQKHNKLKTKAQSEKSDKHIKKSVSTNNNILVGDFFESNWLCGVLLFCNEKTESVLRAYNLCFLFPIGFIVLALRFIKLF